VLELLRSGRGRAFLRRAQIATKDQFLPSLVSGDMGGTQIWTDVALIGPEDTYKIDQFVIGDIGTVEDPTIFMRALDQMRARSGRTGLSCADAIALGDTRRDNESSHIGNSVVDLTPGGTYKLIVSCAGLGDDICAVVSEYHARAVLAWIPDLLTEPVPATNHDYAEADA
jgi:hypothetical protein